MKISNWLAKNLDENGLKQIRDAVTLAEKSTAGEIVPMIVRGSSPLGHLNVLLFFILSACFEFCYFAIAKKIGFEFSIETQATLVVGALVGAYLLAKLEVVQRNLTPKSDRVHNSLVRAELEFHRSKIRSTSAHTGVLLFVSMMERYAVVLADEKVAEKLDPAIWNEVLQTLLNGLKAKDFAIGFAKAIDQTGQIMGKHFPASEHLQNDLPNDLQIRD